MIIFVTSVETVPGFHTRDQLPRFLSRQKKTFAEEYNSIRRGFVGDTIMAATPLFKGSNMAVVTSRENQESSSSP